MTVADAGRLGGRVTSEAKAQANRAKIREYWARVRSGEVAAPTRKKKPAKT